MGFAERPSELSFDLVFAGGGVASGFSCGVATVLDEILPEGLYGSLNKVTGLSAGVGSMLYLLSHPELFEKHSLDIWTDTVASEKFIDTRRFWGSEPILNVDYLLDYVFTKLFPLDYQKILDTQLRFRFPVFDMTNKKTVWVGNMNNDWNIDDTSVFHDLVKASMAVPFAYNKTVVIDDDHYIDGAAVEGSHCLDDFDFSRRGIVILNTNSLGGCADICKHMMYAVVGFLLGLFYRKYNMSWFLTRKMFVKGFAHRATYRQLRRFEKQGLLLLIQPSRKIGGVTDNKPRVLQGNYQHGREIAQARREEILNFLYTES